MNRNSLLLVVVPALLACVALPCLSRASPAPPSGGGDNCKDILVPVHATNFSYRNVREMLLKYSQTNFASGRDSAEQAQSKGSAVVPIDGVPIPVDWFLSYGKEFHDRVAYNATYLQQSEFSDESLVYSVFNGVTADQVAAWRDCMNSGRLASMQYDYPLTGCADYWAADVRVTLDSRGLCLCPDSATVTFVNCVEVPLQWRERPLAAPDAPATLQARMMGALRQGGELKAVPIATRICSMGTGPAKILCTFGHAGAADFTVLPPVRYKHTLVQVDFVAALADGECDRPGQGHGPFKLRLSGTTLVDERTGRSILSDPIAREFQADKRNHDGRWCTSWTATLPCNSSRIRLEIPYVTGNCQNGNPRSDHAGNEHHASALAVVLDIDGADVSNDVRFNPAPDKKAGWYTTTMTARATSVD